MLRPFIFLLIVILTTPTWAQGIEDSKVYKRHPGLQTLLLSYWDSFRGAQTVNSFSGGQIAAQMMLSEVEDQLIRAGLSDRELQELRTESAQIYSHDLRAAEIRSERVLGPLAAVDLLKNFSSISDDQIREAAPKLFRGFPDFQRAYAWSLDLAEVDPWHFKLNAGFISLALLENQNYDFKSPEGRAVLDSYIDYANQKSNDPVEVLPPQSETVSPFSPGLPSGSAIFKRIYSRWKVRNPSLVVQAFLSPLRWTIPLFFTTLTLGAAYRGFPLIIGPADIAVRVASILIPLASGLVSWLAIQQTYTMTKKDYMFIKNSLAERERTRTSFKDCRRNLAF